MAGEDAHDYEMTGDVAGHLAGISLLPGDVRAELLHRWAAELGAPAIVDLFAQFLGLANAVARNCREQAAEILVSEGALHPDRTPDLNMPTVFGALMGVRLAEGVDPAGTCIGCAFRLGSVANQSPATTSDAAYCADGWGDFSCHEDMNEKAEPTRKCVGFARVKAATGGGRVAGRFDGEDRR